ncbi:hypothetical protein [Fodinibius saliphilus]|uniref:hypothetical protein n=1 Tax=Fodinibius saliphilus TaxID=1920650 RepID=UPI0014863328|nr:hypothetical protein [Fodinibius saliphilus]
MTTCLREALEYSLPPGLVEETNHISTAFKYITQPTWSHVALNVDYDKYLWLIESGFDNKQLTWSENLPLRARQIN